jgi:DMSO reductase family type II enzyme heme b subunit
MKVSMMKLNWSSLLCVLVCLLFIPYMSTDALAQCGADDDGDGVTDCDDCDDTNADIYPGAPEVNDGLDNQCPGDHGFGVIDETSGNSGFHNPDNRNEYSWPPQVGATLYQYVRSTQPDLSANCSIATTSGSSWIDLEDPPPGGVFFYLNRPVVFMGSWGQNSAWIERTLECGTESVCDNAIDNDGDYLTDCADADCAGVTACSASNRLKIRRVDRPVLGMGPGDGLWNATVANSYAMVWRDDINDTCPPDMNCSGPQPTLSVKAMHDGINIAFLMEWNDTSASTEVFESQDFGDRAVIMLNANRICQMGSPTNPTNMWFWNAADKNQGPHGSVQNLLAGGLGTVTHTSGNDNIQVVSNHTGSQWQVVMSRPLATVDPGDQFEFALGVTTEMAFALYDGAFKQRNGAKWISGRESIDIVP